MKLTVTLVLFQPAALGAGVIATVIVGGVSSILTVALVLFEFPATSVALPVAVWPAPSCVKLTGEAQVATPDSASAQLKLTVTLVLFQPKLLARGLNVAAMLGGVLSILTFVLGVAVFPALSVAVPGML